MKAMNDYKEHQIAKGETPSEVVDQPINRIRP